MPAIQVGVINPSETEKVVMQVPNDIPVRDLQEVMVEQMGLPTRGNNGEGLRYHLNVRNQDGTLERLDDGATLDENDVDADEVLQFTQVVFAGGKPFSILAAVSQAFAKLRKPSVSSDELLRILDRRMEVLDNLAITLKQLVEQQAVLLSESEKKGDRDTLKPEEDVDKTPPLINYLDFDITFSHHPAKSNWYKVNSFCLLSDNERLDGEYEGILPLTQNQLAVEYLDPLGIRVRQKDTSLPLAKDLGAKLFNFAFGGTIRDCFAQCQYRWGDAGQGIRIRLDLTNAPELISYPWEFMWNTEDNFLVWNSYYPVIRYLPSTRPTRPLSLSIKGDEPLRMLVFAANPRGSSLLDIEREQDDLKRALKDPVDSGLLKIRWLEHATIDKLEQELGSGRPHIIHYIGHGGVDEDLGGYISLEGVSTPHEHLSGEQLAVLLGDCRNTQLVVLNTCRGAQITSDDPFSSIAMQLAKAHVPATVAMQYEITDTSAILFSQYFYKYLAMGWSIYEALGKARKTLFLKQAKIESLIPSLYSRSPNGIIFKREKLENNINT